MYGLIGKLKAIPCQRYDLIKILLDGAAGMPGCLSYVVAVDPTDGDAIWITEVWESRELHQASLTLPAVQQAIAEGRPLIAGLASVSRRLPWAGTWPCCRLTVLMSRRPWLTDKTRLAADQHGSSRINRGTVRIRVNPRPCLAQCPSYHRHRRPISRLG